VDLATAELRQAEARAALALEDGQAPVGGFVAAGVVAGGDAQDRGAVEDVLAGGAADEAGRDLDGGQGLAGLTNAVDLRAGNGETCHSQTPAP
jgi:hypothetical protein